MLSKKPAAVDKTQCVACGVCENTCPIDAVQVHRGCYALVQRDRCVGCGRRFSYSGHSVCRGAGRIQSVMTQSICKSKSKNN